MMKTWRISFLAGLLSLAACQGEKAKEETSNEKAKAHKHRHGNQGHSPYAGQQKWDLKAFPPKVIKQLEKGSGMPFYGMAKPAELNSYPGPKHILQGKEQLDLSGEQEEEIQAIYDSMHRQAKALGDSLLANEEKIEAGFAKGSVNRETLSEWMNRSGALYGKLRFAHLQAHLKAKQVLNEEQVQQYNEWRGYE
jgi:hypothetical protein